jgi:hypothetical protein
MRCQCGEGTFSRGGKRSHAPARAERPDLQIQTLVPGNLLPSSRRGRTALRAELKLLALTPKETSRRFSHMVNPVSSAPTQVQPKAAVQPSQTRQPAAAATSKAAVNDTVQLSNAAKIVQEATETQAQTVKEAGAGDQQARALLAREAAARAGTK